MTEQKAGERLKVARSVQKPMKVEITTERSQAEQVQEAVLPMI